MNNMHNDGLDFLKGDLKLSSLEEVEAKQERLVAQSESENLKVELPDRDRVVDHQPPLDVVDDAVVEDDDDKVYMENGLVMRHPIPPRRPKVVTKFADEEIEVLKEKIAKKNGKTKKTIQKAKPEGKDNAKTVSKGSGIAVRAVAGPLILEDTVDDETRLKRLEKLDRWAKKKVVNLPQLVKDKNKGLSRGFVAYDEIEQAAGENTKYNRVMGEVLSWGTPDHNDIAALEERFNYFVQFCADNDLRVTNQMVYFALGLNKDNVFDWESGRGRTPAHSDFIRKVKAYCAGYREILGVDGKLPPTTLIWWQKNYDGFTDKTEVTIGTPEMMGKTFDSGDLKNRLGFIDADFVEVTG